MKKRWKKIVGVILMVTLIGSLTACGGKKNDTVTTTETGKTGSTSDVVTIGVTDTIGSLNPLLMDGTEVVKYATSLEFLPLVELNKDLEFEGQIATSITTEDNFKIFVVGSLKTQKCFMHREELRKRLIINKYGKEIYYVSPVGKDI